MAKVPQQKSKISRKASIPRTVINEDQGMSARTLGISLIFLLTVMVGSVVVVIMLKDAREEAKYITARNFMKGSFPRMISFQYSQTFNCSELVQNKKDFVRLGLDGETPWSKPWIMIAADSKIILTYPLRGSGDLDRTASRLLRDLETTKLEKRVQVALLVARKEGSNIVAEYRCNHDR